jgi:hypothetical protein
MGHNTTASAATATAMGSGTTANSDASTAMGTSTTASGFSSTAMGQGTTASGINSTAMGNGTKANGNNSTAMGTNTTATGTASTAMGSNTTAINDYSLTIGQYNLANSTQDNVAFAIGNGSQNNLSSALRVKFDGNMTIAGTLTQNSDRRLKKDIHSLDSDILEKLQKIEPVYYQFKNQNAHPDGVQLGLIAQEVQAQFPELVTTGSNGYLSLSYSKLSAVLLKGVQEQQEQIEMLKSENEMIRQRLTQLEQKDGIRAGAFPAEGWSYIIAMLVLAGLLMVHNRSPLSISE